MSLSPTPLEIALDLYTKGAEELSELPELERLAGKRVCVVGSTGQIGSVLIETLQAANRTRFALSPIQIYGLARTPPTEPAEGIHFLSLSVSDTLAVAQLPDFDFVLYVAGTASDYLRRRQETIETQVVGLEAFLNRFESCGGFVYISSTRVYGRESDGEPITEQSLACVPPMHTDNVYDSAKRLGESLCLYHARSAQMPITVARLSNIYGAQDSQRSETAISDFSRQAAKNRTILLRGNPDSTRNWTCVQDIAQAIFKTLLRGRPGEAYNIGSKEHLSSREIALLVAETFPSLVAVNTSSEPAPLSLQHISIAKAEAELDYTPRHTFRALAPLVVAKALRNP